MTEDPPPRPRWVTAAVIVGVVVVALFLVLHLAGGGLGRH
jgi:hypothetical protein